MELNPKDIRDQWQVLRLYHIVVLIQHSDFSPKYPISVHNCLAVGYGMSLVSSKYNPCPTSGYQKTAVNSKFFISKWTPCQIPRSNSFNNIENEIRNMTLQDRPPCCCSSNIKMVRINSCQSWAPCHRHGNSTYKFTIIILQYVSWNMHATWFSCNISLCYIFLW